MEWAAGLKKMLDIALEKNVPAMMRAEAKRSFIEEAEHHAEDRGADSVGVEDLMYIAYQVTPPDKVAVMEQTYRDLGVDVDKYRAGASS
jgi:hypothetical protein